MFSWISFLIYALYSKSGLGTEPQPDDNGVIHAN